MITPAQISTKHITDLTFEEMAFVHLDLFNGPNFTKEASLRSTLSFIWQNIEHAIAHEYSKQLMPYLSLCAVLDQLGTCYDRTDKPSPKYKNNIKRALVLFAELEEDDELIDTLYALRNGLLHNVSLSSYDQNKKKHYRFVYNYDIEAVYKRPEQEWNGDYELLDEDPQKYSTSINVHRFKDMVFHCINRAAALNQSSRLHLRLPGGVRQLYYDYIRSVSQAELLSK